MISLFSKRAADSKAEDSKAEYSKTADLTAAALDAKNNML